jgi:ankyrin repeat protein
MTGIQSRELIDAVRDGDLAAVENLLQCGADVNQKDRWEEPVLILAVNGYLADMVKLLLAHGALVNAKAPKGETPLMCAVGNVEIMELLIDNGANLDRTDDNGQTALMWAVRYDEYDSIRLLIDKGAALDMKDDAGMSIHDLAKQSRKPEALQQLIESSRHAVAVSKQERLKKLAKKQPKLGGLS